MIMWITVRTSSPSPAVVTGMTGWVVYSRIPEPWNVWASVGARARFTTAEPGERSSIRWIPSRTLAWVQERGFVFSSISSWRINSRRIRTGAKRRGGESDRQEKLEKIHRSGCQRMKRLGRITRVGRKTMIHWVLNQRTAFSQISPV